MPNSAPSDPLRRAQELSQPQLPKRFYTRAEAGAVEDGWGVMLDGRAARTPAKAKIVVPSRAVAEAVAGEWAAQESVIDPAAMPLTRLVNVALDGVAAAPEAVRGDMVRYAGSDLVAYRAEGPDGLVERQAAAWDPLVRWLAEDVGARLVLVAGIMHVPQHEEALAAVARRLEGLDLLRLTAAHVMTTLTGSVVIALAVTQGRVGAEEGWAAAHVDEDWNIAQWGEDAEAAARRAARFADMAAASRLAELAGQP